MAAIGISKGGEIGWICRSIYTGGSFADFGGDGYTKEDAIAEMIAYNQIAKFGNAYREDWISSQLFAIKPKKQKKEVKAVILGRFLESERIPMYGGWDLH